MGYTPLSKYCLCIKVTPRVAAIRFFENAINAGYEAEDTNFQTFVILANVNWNSRCIKCKHQFFVSVT